MTNSKSHLTIKISKDAAMLVIAVSTLGCSPAFIPPPPSQQLLTQSPTSEAIIQRGFTIHQNTCAKCHAFEDPSRHPINDLSERIMPKMAAKSKLSQADAKAVLTYLLAIRKDS